MPHCGCRATRRRRGPHLPWCYGFRGGPFARPSADLAPRLRDPLSLVACPRLTYHGATASEEVRLRVRLPIWRRGCGIRSRLSLAPAAFCSSFRTACERLLDTRMADGVTRPGFFPQLAHRLGARSFDFDTPDLRMSTHRMSTLLASDSDLGHAFSDAWALLREEVDGVVDVAPFRAPRLGVLVQRVQRDARLLLGRG